MNDDLLLYDVTSTYFEGIGDPAIAQRGYSRDHRPDCSDLIFFTGLMYFLCRPRR